MPRNPPVPVQIICPVGARYAIERRIGFSTVPCLIPGLEAESGNAKFRTGQALRRPQQIHPRGVQPDSCARFVLRRIDHRYLADAGATQRKGERTPCLAAADDRHVVVDAGSVRDPVLRIGPDEFAELRGQQHPGLRGDVRRWSHDAALPEFHRHLQHSRPLAHTRS